jgi:hypothetical protein
MLVSLQDFTSIYFSTKLTFHQKSALVRLDYGSCGSFAGWFLLDNGVMNYDATLFGRSGHGRIGFVRHTIDTGGMFRFHVGVFDGVIYAAILG